VVVQVFIVERDPENPLQRRDFVFDQFLPPVVLEARGDPPDGIKSTVTTWPRGYEAYERRH
jgi:hypothetical protein